MQLTQEELALARDKWKVYVHSELAARCEVLDRQEYLIEGLLPSQCLALIVGDSGLGKSPLAYQMAICVASGVDFLRAHVKQSRVLYLDFENGPGQINEMLTRLAAHLKLQSVPEDLYLWNINDAPADFGNPKGGIGSMIAAFRPGLVIVDPLTALDPEAENKNSAATAFYQTLRRAMRKCSCSLVGVHHPKKQSQERRAVSPSLQGDEYRKWFAEARGSGVLINGADVRLGIDLPDKAYSGQGNDTLVVRGYGRVKGEIPTMYLSRVLDESGEPIGYQRVVGVDLLGNPDQEQAFKRLPEQFSLKTAKQNYGRQDQATLDFLLKCIANGILRKLGRGLYEKVKLTE